MRSTNLETTLIQSHLAPINPMQHVWSSMFIVAGHAVVEFATNRPQRSSSSRRWSRKSER